MRSIMEVVVEDWKKIGEENERIRQHKQGMGKDKGISKDWKI